MHTEELSSTLKVRVQFIREEGLHVVQELSPEIFQLTSDDRIDCVSPLKADLVVKYVGSSNILVTGSLETEISCTCDRCLEKYSQKVVQSEVCQYFEHFDEEIDLTDRIREDILIAFPQNLLCDEKCAGLCIQCGANLNEAECECEAPDFEEEEQEETGNVWDALDGLKLD